MSAAKNAARATYWDVVDRIQSHPAHVRTSSYHAGRGVITCHDCIAQFTGPISVIVAAWNAHLPATTCADLSALPHQQED